MNNDIIDLKRRRERIATKRSIQRERMKKRMMVAMLILAFIGSSIAETFFQKVDAATREDFKQTMDEVSERQVMNGVITAYSSSVDETDDTPFITASNQKVRSGIVANNCLKFGSKVEIDGDEYEVQDRMNKRYGCEHFDVWKESKAEAVEHGRQFKQVAILK